MFRRHGLLDGVHAIAVLAVAFIATHLPDPPPLDLRQA